MEMESMNYIDVLEAVEVEEWEDDAKGFPMEWQFCFCIK